MDGLQPLPPFNFLCSIPTNPVSKASFSEQRSVASYTSVTNRVSRLASPISPTTLSPATACFVITFKHF
nr:unnamed protein product [Callosobruchus chinensis]